MNHNNNKKEGKYFFFTCRLNNLVMGVKDSCTKSGTTVIMNERKVSMNENQLWFEDIVTGTIRSKLNDALCLDINEKNYLVVDYYDPRNSNQKWKTRGGSRRDRIEHCLEEGRFLEIESNRKRSQVKTTSFKQSDNQKWDFDHIEPDYIHMINTMTGKALDVKGWNKKAGAAVIATRFNGCLTQQWYEDIRGGIRSRLNDFDLSVAGISDGAKMNLMPHKDGLDFKNQLWTRSGEKIVNMFNPHLVVDGTTNAQDEEDTQLYAHQYGDVDCQHWQYKSVWEKYGTKQF